MTREDAVSAALFALEHEDVSGPVNVTSPEPVTNREFTAALGRALGRPAFLPAPAFALRMVFGRMADETLLSSARALPARLTACGFTFRGPELEPALRQMLAETQRLGIPGRRAPRPV